MGSDLNLVIQWWGTLFLVGAAAYPLTKNLFSKWRDRGYLFSKAVGMATVTYLVYLLGTLRLLPFSQMSMAVAMGAVFVAGVVLSVSKQMDRADRGNKGDKGKDVRIIVLFLLEEAFFVAALLFWVFIKAHEPSIHGLEKFMDFGFTKSILDSAYFPAPDMWYTGGSINYYYFGHIVMAMLTKFSGLDLRYTFNLMLATIFAFTATMSFSIGFQISQIGQIRQIGKSLIAGGLIAFLVTLSGNLQTIYAFTRGYDGDKVRPFWQLFWPIWGIWERGGIGEVWGKIGEGLNRYWYANATRFIPYTIHEFPSYSFVVSDVHGHVLSLPFVLLVIALLISMVISDKLQVTSKTKQSPKFDFSLVTSHLSLIFYGFLVAVLLMTNALDGPIYFGLLAVVLVIVNWSNSGNWGNWKMIAGLLGLVVVVAGLISLPFILHFHSFVSGLAVNCPPAFLADSKIGPFLFEGAEKCQRSPLWMMLILWGFFIYCGAWLIAKIFNFPLLRQGFGGQEFSIFKQFLKRKSNFPINTTEKLLLIFFVFSILLIIFPEFFYFKDIYPMHFRSNTMFKLGYQAFILFSIVSGYTIISLLTEGFGKDVVEVKSQKSRLRQDFGGQAKVKNKIKNLKVIFLIFLAPFLFLVSIYPIFSVRSYFDSLRTYKGLDGLAWIRDQYPSDYAAIEWLNKNAIRDTRDVTREEKCLSQGISLVTCHISLPVIVEADGDSYTDYARFSAFTGFPTIIGWPVHEWLWRGSYDIVAPRRADVEKIYESQNLEETRRMLKNYNVKYVIVGVLEREKYAGFLNESKFLSLGKVVFRSGETVIYEIQ